MTRVLIFGPSTTYGAWDKEGGWAQRIRKYLDEKQFSDPELYFEVFNLGVSGDTSSDILERIEFETKQRLKLLESNEEVIILVSIGVNDSVQNNKTKKNKVSIEKYSSNIVQIIKIAKKYATNVVFVGNKLIDEKRVNPIPWLSECSYLKDLVEEYDSKVAEECKKANVRFIDVYSQFKKIKGYQKLLADGVHPTSEGHKVIFEIVKKYLVANNLLK